AEASADFEDSIPSVGPHDVHHPFIEAWSAIDPLENISTLGFVRVDVARGAVMQNCPEGARAIPPANFLSFAIGTARIADRNFEYAGATLGQLDGELGLHVKRGTFERNALQQV